MTTSITVEQMIDTLEMDPKHPGIKDPTYIARRFHFYQTGKDHRLENKGLPAIEYTDEEHRLWQQIYTKLAKRQDQYACKMYLDCREKLGLNEEKMPQVTALSERVQQYSGFGLGPAEGLLSMRDFFLYLAQRRMPCTQFLRHPTHPEYTPEPDAVHDIIGHVPQLLNQEYADLIQIIAKGIAKTPDERLVDWERIYWFTIEFGLIEEDAGLKAFGAGLLSSFGEIEYGFSDEVKRLPMDFNAIIQHEYDSTRMQDVLYVIPSLAALREAVEQFIEVHGYN